jgi:hypothetical protein
MLPEMGLTRIRKDTSAGRHLTLRKRRSTIASVSWCAIIMGIPEKEISHVSLTVAPGSASVTLTRAAIWK